jgi:exosortase
MYLRFALLSLVSTAFLWRPIAATYSLALHSDEYTHIILIVPISIALIFSEWNWVKSKAASANSMPFGVSMFASGWLLVALNHLALHAAPDVNLAVDTLALVILWISGFIMCFGSSAAHSLLFPLFFLFWIVPMPSLLLVTIVRWLQHGSAVAAWLLFSMAGVPALRDGVLVSIPGLTVEVAKECSSIRSSLMLLVTTIVLAHVLLKESWRKILVVLLAIPLSVAKNGLRIFTLGMLATRVDRSFLTGRLHHEGGILFLILALLVIGIVLVILRRGERGRAKTSPLRSITDRIPSLVVDGSSN